MATTISEEKKAQIVAELKKGGVGVMQLVRKYGVSKYVVGRLKRVHGLKQHQEGQFIELKAAEEKREAKGLKNAVIELGGMRLSLEGEIKISGLISILRVLETC